MAQEPPPCIELLLRALQVAEPGSVGFKTRWGSLTSWGPVLGFQSLWAQSL